LGRPRPAASTIDYAAPDLAIATCPGIVSNGFAASLDHPGGHVTGIGELNPGVTAKRLKLLKTAAPPVSREALLSTTPGRGGNETQLADAEQAAAALGVIVTASTHSGAVCVAERPGVFCRRSIHALSGMVWLIVTSGPEGNEFGNACCARE